MFHTTSWVCEYPPRQLQKALYKLTSATPFAGPKSTVSTSHHNKYKCRPDSPYPRILGQCSPIFYKPQASPDLISAPTQGGHEQFSHPRHSPHYAEKDVHISRKDNYPNSPVQPETVSRDDRDREYCDSEWIWAMIDVLLVSF